MRFRRLFRSPSATRKNRAYYNNFTDQELTDVIQTNVFQIPSSPINRDAVVDAPRPHATDPNLCYLDKLSFERFPNSEEQALRGQRQPQGKAQRGAKSGRPVGVF